MAFSLSWQLGNVEKKYIFVDVSRWWWSVVINLRLRHWAEVSPMQGPPQARPLLASDHWLHNLDIFQNPESTEDRTTEFQVNSIVKLKSKRKMSEILSNENKLSMLISDSMEALADPSSLTKQACISLDAGPLQRVWCHPCRLGIPRGHLCGDIRISLWPWEWWTGIQSHHRRHWGGAPRGSGQRSGHCSEGRSSSECQCYVSISSSLFQISFSAAGLGGVRTNWDAVLWQDTLYVSVTASQLADGSKRAFVSLLEYAEEELGVSNVVACLDKCVIAWSGLFSCWLITSVSGCTMTTRTSSATSSFLDSSPLLRGTSFTLLPPMLSVSCTPSNRKTSLNIVKLSSLALHCLQTTIYGKFLKL